MQHYCLKFNMVYYFEGPIQYPVASSCCQSLIGCRECLDVWFETSGQCPKCRSEEGHAGRIDLRSLDGEEGHAGRIDLRSLDGEEGHAGRIDLRSLDGEEGHAGRIDLRSLDGEEGHAGRIDLRSLDGEEGHAGRIDLRSLDGEEGHAGRIDLRSLDGVVKVLLPLIGGDIEIEYSIQVVNVMI